MTRPDLVDLRTLTTRWRIRRDTGDPSKPHLLPDGLPVIPGRRGSVSAHDLTTLVVYLAGRRFVRAALRGLPAGWRRHQIGDDEANLLVPVADLDRACELVRAFRRRHLSEDHRAALLAFGSSTQFRGEISTQAHDPVVEDSGAAQAPQTAPSGAA